MALTFVFSSRREHILAERRDFCWVLLLFSGLVDVKVNILVDHKYLGRESIAIPGGDFKNSFIFGNCRVAC